MHVQKSISIFNLYAVIFLAIFCSLVAARAGFADTALLYKEMQLIVGSDSNLSGPIYYSQNQNEAMQKPGLGIDYIRRISGDTGDKAIFAFQGRLAWNEQGNSNKFEAQIYNAYLKFKNPIADLWIGHSRAAYGLSSYFDSHGLLLQTLGMTDLGFDRDWGAGITHDTDWGDYAFSYTLGSGMSLKTGNSYLYAGRISFGVLNRDNYNIGLSKANGDIDQIGIADYLGVDAALLYENYEIRLENTSGTRANLPYQSSFVRGGIKLFDEDKLKLELQQVNTSQGGVENQTSAAGISYNYNEDITLRAMYQNNRPIQDTKVIFQCYYYAPW